MVKESVGDHIRAQRTELGMSQGELERQTGIPRAEISRLETGPFRPRDRARLDAIATALGLPPAALHQLAPSANPLPAPPPTRTNLGALIRSRREELGLSLRELGWQMETVKGEVIKWESGRIKQPNRRRLEQLAAALSLPLSELIEAAASDAEDSPRAGVRQLVSAEPSTTFHPGDVRYELAKHLPLLTEEDAAVILALAYHLTDLRGAMPPRSRRARLSRPHHQPRAGNDDMPSEVDSPSSVLDTIPG